MGAAVGAQTGSLRRRARWLALSAGLAALVLLETPAAGAAQAKPPPTDLHALMNWLAHTQDHEGRPFAVLDKRQARLWLFDKKRRPLGSSPVLLGAAHGDVSVPGIGERALSDIRPEERTTPAGRFIMEPGTNAAGEDIFWVDYGAAVSMHRVRNVHPAERRLQRMATPTPADNRISYGCINVPVAFYDQHVRPLFAAGHGVVYVLPETRPLQALFSPR